MQHTVVTGASLVELVLILMIKMAKPRPQSRRLLRPNCTYYKQGLHAAKNFAALIEPWVKEHRKAYDPRDLLLVMQMTCEDEVANPPLVRGGRLR